MRTLSFLLLLITGLALALPGAYLAVLGGSLYYAVAGVLVLISAVLVLRGSAAGIGLFWLVLLGTVLWSVREVGLDGWALMPRLVFLSAGALWLLWFAPSRLAAGTRLASTVVLLAAMAGLLGYSFFKVAAPVDATAGLIPAALDPASAGDWAHYGNSLHATRYSDLAQITPANAANLEQAWVY